MSERVDLIILGASARAAAFSALRAGLRPWCADLFADADLRAICPALRLDGAYPDGFADLLETAPQAPWLYTGGLENHPRLVARMARTRPLWGNGAATLRAVRDPANLFHLLRESGIPVPHVCQQTPDVSAKRWLLKPLRSAGGTGIRFYTGTENDAILRRSYLQEYVAGESLSALFVAGERAARLLGVTRQLVGETWLHAAPFHFCGSIGPILIDRGERSALERLGTTLAAGCGLRGLFGVDGIWRDGTFLPVEVNPRYTASVEVLEYATGLSSLTWHRRAFDPVTSDAPEPEQQSGIVGKAILFARATMTFPSFKSVLPSVVSGGERFPPPCSMPQFADIPNAGQRIEARRPILTLFASAVDVKSCFDALRTKVAEIERCLL